MCSVTSLIFCLSKLLPAEVAERRVLELGARMVNGSVRPVIETWRPAAYVGTDLEAGPGVDLVADAGDLLGHFGPESFDVVISTEMLEHVVDWRKIVQIMKALLCPGGILLVTTRSRGFEYHAYPHDHWRYELADFEAIFADMDIEALEPDALEPGVFLRARKPLDFVARDLAAMPLYNIVAGHRTLTAVAGAGLRYRRLVMGYHAKEAWRGLKRRLR